MACRSERGSLGGGAEDPRVTALIGIAPPVTRYDFSPVTIAGKPTFIIHGERDELIPVKEVRKFYGQLPSRRSSSLSKTPTICSMATSAKSVMP